MAQQSADKSWHGIRQSIFSGRPDPDSDEISVKLPVAWGQQAADALAALLPEARNAGYRPGRQCLDRTDRGARRHHRVFHRHVWRSPCPAGGQTRRAGCGDLARRTRLAAQLRPQPERISRFRPLLRPGGLWRCGDARRHRAYPCRPFGAPPGGGPHRSAPVPRPARPGISIPSAATDTAATLAALPDRRGPISPPPLCWRAAPPPATRSGPRPPCRKPACCPAWPKRQVPCGRKLPPSAAAATRS